MLDSVTKKRIDDLRNILVGKIPSPQSQVEQITTGLIYKFMYDMDQEAVEMGGIASFFINDFEKYSWNNLFDPKLSGVQKVQLYGDAIEHMYTNPSAPQLFREIFKNSFLPFKDPATLNMFLKEINEFHYSHSEKLGDAFEYLLSFMGSQGDAGQFRTPRHIIDFIVAIVNPQKNESVLDPACGTAGFLISSYKHILEHNTNKKLGDQLTASDRKKIGENLVGYDISPDMTRISLVNMYLHQFASPLIHEYDTLSSEDRWNEYYDVILANPPFFSPTGGIQPHSRFGVQSTRAEVLFVDYIMEHLKPSGRAGIIVPEGVIFQTGSAYKNLRKKLIEDSLVGIISLPAGIFQPYSGVKTSILILDKIANSSNDNIFFAKVDNDGFSLGSQRTAIDQNDLPSIVHSIKHRNSNESNLLFISKSKILSEESCNLTASKYVEKENKNSKYPILPITDLFDVITPNVKIKSSDFLEGGSIPIIDQSNKKIAGYWNEDADKVIVNRPVVIFGDHTKAIKYIDFDFVAGADGIKILSPNEMVLPKYFYYTLRSIKLPSLGYSRHFKTLKEIDIPVPSIDVQKEIVRELDGYQEIIDGSKKIIDNYKPSFEIKSDWKLVNLIDLVEINPKKSEINNIGEKIEVSFVPMEDLNENRMFFHTPKVKNLEDVYKGYTYFKDNDVILAKVTPCFENGKAGIAQNLKNGIGFGSSEFYVLRTKSNVLPEWIYLNIITQQFVSGGINNFTGTSGLRRVPKSYIENYKIPLPTLSEQQEITSQFKQELLIIDGNRYLLEKYRAKIQNKLDSILGKS